MTCLYAFVRFYLGVMLIQNGLLLMFQGKYKRLNNDRHEVSNRLLGKDELSHAT